MKSCYCLQFTLLLYCHYVHVLVVNTIVLIILECNITSCISIVFSPLEGLSDKLSDLRDHIRSRAGDHNEDGVQDEADILSYMGAMKEEIKSLTPEDRQQRFQQFSERFPVAAELFQGLKVAGVMEFISTIPESRQNITIEGLRERIQDFKDNLNENASHLRKLMEEGGVLDVLKSVAMEKLGMTAEEFDERMEQARERMQDNQDQVLPLIRALLARSNDN